MCVILSGVYYCHFHDRNFLVKYLELYKHLNININHSCYVNSQVLTSQATVCNVMDYKFFFVNSLQSDFSKTVGVTTSLKVLVRG